MKKFLIDLKHDNNRLAYWAYYVNAAFDTIKEVYNEQGRGDIVAELQKGRLKISDQQRQDLADHIFARMLNNYELEQFTKDNDFYHYAIGLLYTYRQYLSHYYTNKNYFETKLNYYTGLLKKHLNYLKLVAARGINVLQDVSFSDVMENEKDLLFFFSLFLYKRESKKMLSVFIKNRLDEEPILLSYYTYFSKSKSIVLSTSDQQDEILALRILSYLNTFPEIGVTQVKKRPRIGQPIKLTTLTPSSSLPDQLFYAFGVTWIEKICQNKIYFARRIRKEGQLHKSWPPVKETYFQQECFKDNNIWVKNGHLEFKVDDEELKETSFRMNKREFLAMLHHFLSSDSASISLIIQKLKELKENHQRIINILLDQLPFDKESLDTAGLSPAIEDCLKEKEKGMSTDALIRSRLKSIYLIREVEVSTVPERLQLPKFFFRKEKGNFLQMLIKEQALVDIDCYASNYFPKGRRLEKTEEEYYIQHKLLVLILSSILKSSPQLLGSRTLGKDECIDFKTLVKEEVTICFKFDLHESSLPIPIHLLISCNEVGLLYDVLSNPHFLCLHYELLKLQSPVGSAYHLKDIANYESSIYKSKINYLAKHFAYQRSYSRKDQILGLLNDKMYYVSFSYLLNSTELSSYRCKQLMMLRKYAIHEYGVKKPFDKGIQLLQTLSRGRERRKILLER